jgi:3-phosphoshikimate 1-carboxyvinyltransferase
MIASLANGESRIHGLSTGQDVGATRTIMEQLGATSRVEDSSLVVIGPSEGLRPSAEELDCGNSGTTIRLLSGIASSIEGVHQLVGDASLSKRPMDRVAEPLSLMGATVEGQGPRVTAPLMIRGRGALTAISFHVPKASAQVKSAILFAGLVAQGPTEVFEDVRTRTTTEDMFELAGLSLRAVNEGEGRAVTLQPGRPRAREWHIPGDPSQAAFFVVLATLHHDGLLDIVDLDPSPERTGFLDVLERMGAHFVRHQRDGRLSLTVSSAELSATEIHAHDVPSVDEVPILTVAAASARGVSAFRDMGELRLKESDRFAGSMELASALGCRVWSEGDDFFVEGLGHASKFSPFRIDAGLDHRIVMSSAIAASVGAGGVITNASTVASSYPHFFDDLAGVQ